MLALAISLCWGFGGILNLGQGIPFGLGAYGMAMTMQMQSQDASNPIPPFMLNNSLDHLPMLWAPFRNTAIGIALALIVPTLFCIVFGGLMFRARVSGPFFAIMTLAMLSALVHPYPRHAALYQRRERHHAAVRHSSSGITRRPLQSRGLLDRVRAASAGHGCCQADDAQPLRACRPGGARRRRTSALPRLQRRRLRNR